MRHGTGMAMWGALWGALWMGLLVGCGQSTAPEMTAANSSAGPTPAASDSHSASPAKSAHSDQQHSSAIASGPASASEQTFHSGQALSHSPAPSSPAPSSAPTPAVDAGPDAVVTAFLEATRRGDDQLAANLLSQKALEETSRIGLAVKPPGTPSMEYQIAEVEYAEEVSDGAYVHSTWTEQFEGVEEEFEVTWVLRRETEGWRIVGMAAELQPGDPPFFLNFEDPAELYRQMQEIADDSRGDDELAGDARQIETARNSEPSIYGSSDEGHAERR
jgi:hypothetical protein